MHDGILFLPVIYKNTFLCVSGSDTHEDDDDDDDVYLDVIYKNTVMMCLHLVRADAYVSNITTYASIKHSLHMLVWCVKVMNLIKICLFCVICGYVAYMAT
jgi:hypothetical protein